MFSDSHIPISRIFDLEPVFGIDIGLPVGSVDLPRVSRLFSVSRNTFSRRYSSLKYPRYLSQSKVPRAMMVIESKVAIVSSFLVIEVFLCLSTPWPMEMIVTCGHFYAIARFRDRCQDSGEADPNPGKIHDRFFDLRQRKPSSLPPEENRRFFPIFAKQIVKPRC